MSLEVSCDCCGADIINPGAALLFSPPEDNKVTKTHVCVNCYKILNEFINNKLRRFKNGL